MEQSDVAMIIVLTTF
jgi:hypothetical protein